MRLFETAPLRAHRVGRALVGLGLSVGKATRAPTVSQSDLLAQPSHPDWHQTIPPKSLLKAEFKQKKKKKSQAIANCGSNKQCCLLLSRSDPQGRAGPCRCCLSVPRLQIWPSQSAGGTSGAALSPPAPLCVMLLEVRRKAE